MKNTTKLMLLYILLCALVLADFVLFGSGLNAGHDWKRTVKLAAAACVAVGVIVTGFFTYKLYKAVDKQNKSQRLYDAPHQREIVPAERAVFDESVEIRSGHTDVEMNVWGKRMPLTVIGHDDVSALTKAERAALVWFITEAPYQSAEVQNEVLKYINDVYENSGDEWKRTQDTAILHDETHLSAINISVDEKSNDVTVALCGECNCDDEHGISVVFKNKEFSGVGEYSDYENADWLYDRRTGEEIERNEKYTLIEEWGYADKGGVFEFFSFAGSKIDADNNPIEKGKLVISGAGYRKTLLTVCGGKLGNYYDGLTFIDTDKELKSKLGGFHSEYDIKDIDYTVKTINVTECTIPGKDYKIIKRVMLNIGKENKNLDLVILSDEFDKLKSFLSFIDDAHTVSQE